MNSPNCAGAIGAACRPIALSFSAISGSAMMRLISRLSLSTTGAGVAAGATTPYQVPVSKPGRPDSAIVGTSGRMATRLSDDTASGRILPAFTCGIRVTMLSNCAWNTPPSRSLVAGALPLYGTCTAEMPAALVKNSPPRCCAVPAPPLPMFSLPGLALAKSMSSLSVRAGSVELATSSSGALTSSDTGAKSLTES